MKRIFVVGLMLMTSGCALTEHCDSMSLRIEHEHVSHPLAGYPFGPASEEDALDHVGPVGRCTVGRGYVDMNLGWKIGDGGFYGPRLTGGVRIGVEIWKR